MRLASAVRIQVTLPETEPHLRNGKTYKNLHELPPARHAQAAGLRYVLDDRPGISRIATGGGFRYLSPEGAAVRDRATLARIKAVVIPPAWTDVWICARDDGHIQATGRDARRRKQYRYHTRWREVRDETKYSRVASFARALPRIRRRVRRDLALRGLPREKVLAAVVRLLETTFIRVGNEEYARQNESYGLTTLRNRQLCVRGQKLKFEFRGKSGVEHTIELTDPRLATLMRSMQDLPGEELFQYVDEEGETRSIESADVNSYLKEIAGEEFTTKDFRTLAGTMLALKALLRAPSPSSGAEAKRNITLAVAGVAEQLGNTAAVCRKCYIHPEVLNSYTLGTLPSVARRRRSAEAVILPLLHRHAVAKRVRPGGTRTRSLAQALKRTLALFAQMKRTSPAAIAGPR